MKTLKYRLAEVLANTIDGAPPLAHQTTIRFLRLKDTLYPSFQIMPSVKLSPSEVEDLSDDGLLLRLPDERPVIEDSNYTDAEVVEAMEELFIGCTVKTGVNGAIAMTSPIGRKKLEDCLVSALSD